MNCHIHNLYYARHKGGVGQGAVELLMVIALVTVMVLGLFTIFLRGPIQQVLNDGRAGLIDLIAGTPPGDVGRVAGGEQPSHFPAQWYRPRDTRFMDDPDMGLGPPDPLDPPQQFGPPAAFDTQPLPPPVAFTNTPLDPPQEFGAQAPIGGDGPTGAGGDNGPAAGAGGPGAGGAGPTAGGPGSPGVGDDTAAGARAGGAVGTDAKKRTDGRGDNASGAPDSAGAGGPEDVPGRAGRGSGDTVLVYNEETGELEEQRKKGIPDGEEDDKREDGALEGKKAKGAAKERDRTTSSVDYDWDWMTVIKLALLLLLLVFIFYIAIGAAKRRSED